MQQLHLNLTRSTTVKPRPQFTHSTVFDYHSSPDGMDTNLLVLLHGLGDTHIPFTQLGGKLNLPQTAILSLRAFERVPILEEEAYQWWDSFDFTGATIAHPNPSVTLNKLVQILETLTSEQVGWNPERIHLFGFAQGGSCLAELGLLWARKHQSSSLGSIVSVSGPLLSLPTGDYRSVTPILLWYRKGEDEPGKWRTWLERGYRFVHQSTAPSASSHHEQMPATRQEWEPILQFWSKFLKSRHPWEDQNNSSTFEVRTN